MKFFLEIFLFFLLITQIHYPQWINQNPVPDGNDLWSTFFVDDSTGWIVGSEGFIKKTTNAGLDWVLQESNTTLILKSVQFINQNTGWICGEAGLILKTTNGGQNWFSLTSGTTQHLTDIQFCTPDTGYVVGYSGTILKSTNGGSSWISQSFDSSYDLYSVDFVDALLGYTAGTIAIEDSLKILKTTDGGLNWIVETMQGSLDSYANINTIEFIDADTGFVGGCNGGGWPYICKTTDGGVTWNQPLLQIPLKLQESNNRKQFSSYIGVSSIYFKDSHIGYAVANLQGWMDRSVYTTTDGGSTWIRKYESSDAPPLISVHGNSTGEGWAVGFGGIIFITEDDGNSWAQILSGTGDWDELYSVFCINENIGWTGGKKDLHGPSEGNMILKTTNGGKIWRTQFFEYSLSPILSFYFINEYIGWAIGENSYRIIVPGENWSSINISGSSVFFINQDTGWVANDSDYGWKGIYKSTDGGITWSSQDEISSSSIYFNDINTGWAVGAGGRIVKSTNGGASWFTKVSGTTNDLKWVKFYNSNLGMCVGNTGTVLLSTDGGESWISNSVGTTENLTSVTFTNSTTVWITGSNGTILHTTDLGYNWTSYDSVTTNDLTSITFIDEYTGWVAGWNGTMFKYSVEPPLPPVWSNQILVEDAGGTESSQVLTFGQHTDATDSLDSSLGEYELPPTPPTSIFDARFNLPTNPQVSSFIDYRDSAKTDIIWTMTFQPGSAGYPITFSWDSTSFPEGTIYLKDRINGSFVNVNMKFKSSYVLTNTDITSLKISYKGICSTVSVNDYWNMISVPYLADDMSASNLFPTATSNAFSYHTMYIVEDTLEGGVGYWLKFGGNEQVQICGSTMEDTVGVKTGWNMIGGNAESIPVNQITTFPPGIIATYFFGYNNGYYIADTLKSGKGYWVRVTEDGVLNLNGGTLEKDGEEKQPFTKIAQDWGKIKMTDSNGKSITLYATEDEIKSSLDELPPMPPTGIFDARFSSGRVAEDLSSEQIIQISSDSYPITIKAEGINLTVRDRINGELLNEELNDGEEIRITNNNITSIDVSGRITGGLPISYELYQNYPNPFNPNTTIKFAVPKESNVNLSIYNVLGELVSTMVNEEMKPGYYEVEFNASDLASGVYLYRIKAGDFIETNKMILIK